MIRFTGVRAARSQTALDNASSATLTTDLQGKVNYANRAARTYFQRHEGDMRSAAADFRADDLEGLDLATLLGGSEGMRVHLRTWPRGIRNGSSSASVTSMSF